MNYPYDHDYIFRLGIGRGGEQSDTINPSTSSSYSEKEWNDLSDEQKEEWLNAELKEWANGFIDMSVSVD